MKLSVQHLNREVKLELSMTSMIDVVFLLLIFFLVTTSFIRPEHRLRSSIKVDQQTEARGAVDLEPAIIDIIPEGGGFVFRLGGVKSSELEPIGDVLATFQNYDEGAFVRVVDAAPFDMPARAINLCKQKGFELVTLIPLENE
jgi:biopolymer transport protein ExbD